MSNLPLTVMIESPYAAPTEAGVHEHLAYLSRCLVDSVQRGEAPFASHGFYTLFLNDRDPEQRATGMRCGDAWTARCESVVFYVDLGFSAGMMHRLEMLVPDISGRTTVQLRSLDHDAAWMRALIDGLPDHIHDALDRVLVR